MAKQKLTDLTEEQHAALQEYAAAHGHSWKEDLRDAWTHAAEPGALQRLRNMTSFGPRGLIAYRLKAAQ